MTDEITEGTEWLEENDDSANSVADDTVAVDDIVEDEAEEDKTYNFLDADGDGKITINDIIRKLTSRKFWISVATFVFLIMVYCGADENSATQIVAIIMAGATMIGYVIGEGLADKGNDIYGDVTVPGVSYPSFDIKDDSSSN